MSHLPDDPGRSHREGKIAMAGPRLGRDRLAAGRNTDRPATAWAVLDRLRDAAAAHDGDLPAFEIPELLERRSA